MMVKFLQALKGVRAISLNAHISKKRFSKVAQLITFFKHECEKGKRNRKPFKNY